MKAKLVSVIIPVYNGAKYLAEALDSVFAQDYRPIEVIVVDDGSTDDSATIAQSYDQVIYLHHENQGNVVARNIGLKHCSGELIAFLDADDLWVPDKLTQQTAYLESHPQAGVCFGRMRNFLQEGTLRPCWAEEGSFTGDLVAYAMGTLLTHRSVFDSVGEFNTSYSNSGADFEWLICAKEAGILIGMIDDVFLLRRIHESNMSHNLECRQTMNNYRIQLVKAVLDRRRKNSAPSN
jgi:glycosyltransferase involved in cell wall biosynthesis